MYLYCEEAVIQGNQTAGSAEPDGGRAQGCPQYAGGGKASATGFTRWQRREMAHHQFQTGRPCHGQMGIAWAFPSSNSRKSLEYATRQFIQMGGKNGKSCFRILTEIFSRFVSIDDFRFFWALIHNLKPQFRLFCRSVLWDLRIFGIDCWCASVAEQIRRHQLTTQIRKGRIFIRCCLSFRARSCSSPR
jgi:hypothetical protein